MTGGLLACKKPFCALKECQCFLDDSVSLVDNVEILAHIPQVAGHKSLELGAESGHGSLEFSLILGLDVLLSRLSHNVVNHALGHFKVAQEGIERGITLLEFLAMGIYITEIGVNDEAVGQQLAMESCGERRVKWHKVVGHNAATAIYRAVLAQRLILQ